MRSVPRHAFVPEALQGRAYGDHALPISGSQTISQPYIVARMTELLEINSESRVLEIGAGSGRSLRRSRVRSIQSNALQVWRAMPRVESDN